MMKEFVQKDTKLRMSNRVSFHLETYPETDLAQDSKVHHGTGYYIQRWVLTLLLSITIFSVLIAGLLMSKLAACGSSSSSTVHIAVALTAPKEHNPPEPSHYEAPLSRKAVPEHYDLEIQPFLEPGNFTFRGRMKMTLKANEDTDVLVMNSKNLYMKQEAIVARTLHQEGTSPKVTTMAIDKDKDLLQLKFSEDLKRNEKYVIEIPYVGILNEKMEGFYRGSYKEAGKTKWFANTQFAMTHAREAFPCFDQPDMKTTINITVIRKLTQRSLSNMALHKSVELGNNWVADSYMTSVPMSTYLAAFTVNELQPSGTPHLSVWSKPSLSNSTGFALNIAPKILSYYEKTLGMKYPLAKLDLVAMPEFKHGAMENWGLSTYDEGHLLVDQQQSDDNDKKTVASTIADQLAHNWFGNFVTMKNRNDSWINDAFAKFLVPSVMDVILPNWKPFDDVVVDDVQKTLELDSHYNTTTLMSATKGASLLKMVKPLIGEESIKVALKKYLDKHKFGNVDEDDIWKALQAEVSSPDIDLTSFAKTWTSQYGAPVVTVIRNYDEKTAKVYQSKFMADNIPEPEGTQKWDIPFTYTDCKNQDFDPSKVKLWLKKNNGTLRDMPDKDCWIVGNLEEVGYYRVNYDILNWRKIAGQLKSDHTKIDVLNRAQLIDDALDFAKAGILNYLVSLNVTYYLDQERDNLPWKSFFVEAVNLDGLLSRTPMYGKWKKYVLKLIQPVYQNLGWTDFPRDTIHRRSLRMHILKWACRYGHGPCVDHAFGLYQKWKGYPDDESIIPPNFRTTVYCTAIEQGGPEVWDFMWDRYMKARSPHEIKRILDALTCATEPWLILRYLERIIDPDFEIQNQDGPRLIKKISRNVYGRDLSFQFIRYNWKTVKQMFNEDYVFKTVTKYMTRSFDREEVKCFSDSNLDDVAIFDQAIITINNNILWMDERYQHVRSWLNTACAS